MTASPVMVPSGPNRTGGLIWHLRAWRAQSRWAETREAIARWLAGVSPASDHLVLIGASAGWMMPSDFLSRFRRIDAIDIDPMAPALFGWRQGAALRAAGTRWQFHREDALAALGHLLERWPQASIFFDNVLGQQIYRFSDLAALEDRLARLSSDLAGRDWGSVHDWMSGAAQPTSAMLAALWRPVEMTVEPTGYRLDGQGLTVEDCAQTLLARLGAAGDWQDHLTSQVCPPGTRVMMIPWAFRPQKWHWLQAGWVGRAA